MTVADVCERGRGAYEQRAWGQAYAELSAADEQGRLETADLEWLAMAAYLIGREDHSVEVFERAHSALLDDGDIPRAVRCAFWIGMTMLQRGQHAPRRRLDRPRGAPAGRCVDGLRRARVPADTSCVAGALQR